MKFDKRAGQGGNGMVWEFSFTSPAGLAETFQEQSHSTSPVCKKILKKTKLLKPGVYLERASPKL